MKKTETVSLLIPVYGNNKREITNLLDDISKQTYQYFDVYFVYEKNSFDYDFENFVKNYSNDKIIQLDIFYIIMEENLGIGFALDRGVRTINSDIIIRADAGDRYRDDRVLQIIEAFKESRFDVIYSQAYLISPTGSKISMYAKNMQQLSRSFVFGNAICHPTVAFRRHIVLKIGSYNKNLRYCEDLDLWLRLINEKVQFKCIDHPLVTYNLPVKDRSKFNWYTNLRVRINNIGSPNLIFSIIGIMIVGIYLAMPKKIKETVYAITKK